MAAVQTTSIAQQLADLTECPICSEVFVDPRSLPCIHSFCFKCIDDYGRGKRAGDKMSCPMCRREFAVPERGIDELPKNFFIENMLTIQRASGGALGHPAVCEVCAGEKSNATKYCADCKQNLCDGCANVHRNYRMFLGHTLIGLDEISGLSGDGHSRASNLLPTPCQKHKDKPLDVYCRDCKSAICLVCHIASHKQHDCTDINDVIEQFRRQMSTDVGKMSDGVGRLTEMLASVEHQKDEFGKQVDKTERMIEKKASALKQLVDHNKQTLLEELTSKTGEVNKQLEILIIEIKQRISFIEHLKRYTDELSKNGAAGDVGRETSVLHDRVEELLKFDAIEESRNSLDTIDVQFAESSTTDSNVVGEVSVETVPKGRSPTLTHIIPSTGQCIVGVTSVGSQLFVLRYPANQTIDVYDTTSAFALQRHIKVPNLGHSHGLASCAFNKCLYASCYNTNVVHVVELSTNCLVANWLVGQGPTGLSVNKANNVLVTCHTVHKIQEYARGYLLREVSLQSAGITYPLYAIQLASGQFMASHQHRVCVVDDDGELVRSYGSTTAGSAAGQMYYPVASVQVRNSCVLVADRSNNRVMILNQSLSSGSEMSLPTGGTPQGPFVMYLDESRGRLYVGENEGGRVLVFDDVFGVDVN